MRAVWSWTLNWNEIRPDIVIGSCPKMPQDIEYIRREARASALLSLQHDDCHLSLGIDYRALRRMGAELGLVMERRPTRDFDVPDMRRHLAAAVRTLDGLLRARHRVYVHCTAGTGRSPLAVLGYLTFIEGQPLQDALALIRLRRPGACPSVEAWLGCRADLLAPHGKALAAQAARMREDEPELEPRDALDRVEREALRQILRGGPMIPR